jgi:hypothetical protein
MKHAIPLMMLLLSLLAACQGYEVPQGETTPIPAQGKPLLTSTPAATSPPTNTPESTAIPLASPAKPPQAGAAAKSDGIVESQRLDTPSDDEKAYPRATAVLWADGFLWTANETGLLTRWDVKAWDYEQYRLPGEPVIRALASPGPHSHGMGQHPHGNGQAIYAGTERGDIWQLAGDGSQTQVVTGEFGWVSAIAFDGNKGLWYADASRLGRTDSQDYIGRGLVFLESGGEETVYNLAEEAHAEDDPLKDITALTFDPESATLWVGTHSGGLLRYDVYKGVWQTYNTFNSDLENNTINDLAHAPDGSLWLATGSGVSIYRNGAWENHHLTDDPMDKGAQSLAIARDNTVWVAGESAIARVTPDGTWQVYRAADNPLLSDRFRFVVLDDEDHPWFIGRRGKIHFSRGDADPDRQIWIAYDADVRHFAEFTPAKPSAEANPPQRDFPPPTKDYVNWLQAWPRPEADNGRGMHFLQTHQFDTIEAQRQVNRLKRLKARWALVHYADHEQLMRMAPIFQEAGITVVWRPFVRPDETYEGWAEDVEFLRSRGLPPYMQLYNEPSLAQEWEGVHSVDQGTYWRNLLPAAHQVYDAGGYVGLQFIDPDWLRQTLQTMRAQGMSDIFDRLFFVPHLYGLNHPPEYDEDINSVLGFREFARVFEEEIGFTPVMIAGEGGWRPGEAQDNRYPAISEELHRNYHLAVFDWFRAGELPNGEALPDYLFAFCPWLISDPNDPAAWFDSDSGDRTLTIEAIEAMPLFERKFSWDDHTR